MEELKILQDSWGRIWQMYMTWFAWHFGIHVTALGFVVGNEKLAAKIIPIAVFMISLCLISVFATVKMWTFHNLAIKCAIQAGLSDADQSPIFGATIGQYAPLATLLTNLLTLAAWVFLLIVMRGEVQSVLPQV